MLEDQSVAIHKLERRLRKNKEALHLAESDLNSHHEQSHGRSRWRRDAAAEEHAANLRKRVSELTVSEDDADKDGEVSGWRALREGFYRRKKRGIRFGDEADDSIGERHPAPRDAYSITKAITESKEQLRHPNDPLYVVWDFGANGCSGFAMEAMNFVVPFNDSAWNVHMGIIVGDDFCPGIPHDVMEIIDFFRSRPFEDWEIDIFVTHKQPDAYPSWPYYGIKTMRRPPKYIIGRSMTEVTPAPASWRDNALNRVNELWLPSAWLLDVFAGVGIPRSKMMVMPEALNEKLFDIRVDPMPVKKIRGYNFFSNYKWEERKGWDVLLQAYFEEFAAKDDVCLHIQTWVFGVSGSDSHNPHFVWGKIDTLAEMLGYDTSDPIYRERDLPCVHVMTEEIAMTELPSLYKAMDAFVLPTRGEGWGLPIMEAMLMGLPTAATNHSGPTMFMREDTNYIIPCLGLEPAQGKDYHDGQHWGEPDMEALKRIMRHMFTKRDEARHKGHLARQHILRNFARQPVAKLVYERWRQIALTLPAKAPEPIGHVGEPPTESQRLVPQPIIDLAVRAGLAAAGALDEEGEGGSSSSSSSSSGSDASPSSEGAGKEGDERARSSESTSLEETRPRKRASKRRTNKLTNTNAVRRREKVKHDEAATKRAVFEDRLKAAQVSMKRHSKHDWGSRHRPAHDQPSSSSSSSAAAASVGASSASVNEESPPRKVRRKTKKARRPPPPPPTSVPVHEDGPPRKKKTKAKWRRPSRPPPPPPPPPRVKTERPPRKVRTTKKKRKKAQPSRVSRQRKATNTKTEETTSTDAVAPKKKKKKKQRKKKKKRQKTKKRTE